MKRRSFLFALALCLVLSLLAPLTMTDAHAANGGNCGDNGSNVKWSLDNSGQLYIYGTGAMEDYGSGSDSGWSSLVLSIKSIRVDEGVTHVADNAFNGCYKATSAVLGDTVTSIGSYAFYGCSALAAVSIPSGVTAIEPYTFYGCSKLYTATLPSGLTQIGDRAFFGCSTLYNSSIPSTVVSIGESAFEQCSKFTRISIPSGIQSIGARAFSDTGLMSVTLPEGLTSVGDYAFFACTALRTATIRCEGAEFGSSIFSGCTALTGVTLPEGMTKLTNNYFSGCTALKSVTLPKTLTEIASYAFSGCSGLERIEFPASLTSIGGNAFRNCSALKNILFWGRAPSITSNAFNGVTATAKYLSNQTTWTSAKRINYGGTLTWVAQPVSGSCGTSASWSWSPSTGVLTISGSGAMNDYDSEVALPWADLRTHITGIEIKSGVKTIGKNAFTGCRGATYVTIPSTVTSIGESAFNGCSSITKVTIPNSVTSIGDKAFYGCTGVTELTLSNAVTSIGESAFSQSSIRELTIPASVTSIGKYAFYGPSLESVTFQGSAPTIEGSVFYYNNEKTIAYYPFNDASWTKAIQTSFGGNTAWVGVENGLCKGRCGDNMFWTLNADHTVLTFSGSGDWYPLVERYREDGEWCEDYTPGAWNAFSGTVTSIVLEPGVTIIPESAFRNMDCVQSVSIPESMKEIEQEAFSGCDALASVTVPNGVTSIGGYAFQYCPALTTATLPDSVTYLGPYAFRNCSALTAISIPDGVKQIYNYTFQGCTALETVHIGSGLTKIDLLAFNRASAITRVEIEDLAAWCNVTIASTVESSPLEQGAALYLNGELVTDLVIPDGVTSVSAKTFEGCTSLKSVTIPDSVTAIGKSAFDSCPNLETVSIGDGVKTIGETAFSFCGNLQSISIGSGVTSIGHLAFESNKSLSRVELHDVSAWCRVNFQELNYLNAGGDDIKSSNPFYGGADLYLNGAKVTNLAIPEDVTSIGSRAFLRCGSLESVTIPAGVTSIGSNAFYECANLSAVNLTEGLKRIEENAFYHCSKLGVVTLPEGMQSVGQYAFSGCAENLRVNMPKTLPSFGYDAFRCQGSTQVNITDLPAWYAASFATSPFANSGYSLYLNGQPVTDLVIPDGVASIGKRVFYRCANLQTVTLPASLTKIDEYAFGGCTQLNRIRFLGNAPASIHQYAFNSVTATAEYPAVDATWTTAKRQNYGGTLTWSEHYDYTGTCGTNLKWGLDEAGTLVIYGTGSMDNYYLGYAGTRVNPPWYAYKDNIRSVVVRSGAKSIGNYAFYMCPVLKSLKIENASLSIGDLAFSGSAISMIDFGNGSIVLGAGAFYDCDKIKTLTLGSKISFAQPSNMHFSYCDGLESITIRCAELPANVIHTCGSLSQVTLEGVKSIGAYNFENCPALKTITIPASVTKLSNGLFLRSGLTDVYIQGQDVEFTYEVLPAGVTVHAPECSTAHAYVINNQKQYNYSFAALEGDTSKHVYGDPVWTWNEDHTEATAAFSCSARNDDTQVIDAVITSETTAPTCTEDGYVTATATVSFEGQTFTDVQTLPGESATGHHFGGDPEWIWSEDLSSVTVNFHCADCDAVDAAETEYLDYGREEPTHVKDGSIYATVVAVYQDEEYTEYKEIPLPALGHSYGDPVWTWSEDHSEAKATFTCDCGDVCTLNGSITHEDAPATHFETGLRTFTASVTLDDVTYTDEATAVLPLTPHVYEAAWTWSEDLSTASAVLTCTYGDDTRTLDAVVRTERINPTSEADGADVYTASVTCGGEEFTDEQRVTIHFWNAPEWTWSEDFSSAQAKFTCANCGETVTLDAAVTSETTEPTHVTDGATVYTASAALDGATYTDAQSVTLPALGHEWGAPDWTWSPDGSAAQLTLRCTGCDAEVALDATVTQSKRTEPTCTEDGSVRFVASVRYEGTRYTDNFVLTLPALGHSWSDPVWTWSEDDATADAAFTCANCGETQTISAAVTSQTTEPTHEADGETVYTASVEHDGETFTDAQSVVLPALGHEWGTPDWTWAPDGSAAELTLRCTGGDKEVTLDATVTQTKRTEPTCTEDGSVKLIASVRYDGERYTDTYILVLPALGHVTEVHGAKDATCTEPGLTGDEVCTVCGETVRHSEEIPALGHDYRSVVTEPTCTEQGFTTHTCARCGDTYVDSYVDAAHKTELRGAKDATCTEPGYTGDEVCTVCGETVRAGEEIPALGHDYEFVVTAPTCTEQGFTTHTCKRCGESFVDTYTPLTEHSWDEGSVTLEPTETAEGVRTFTCTVCGATKTEAIPVLEPTQTNPFTDVPEGKFYHDPVLWAISQDPQITTGVTDTTFMPDRICTRAHVVTFLWRANGCPEPANLTNTFKDVPNGKYYTKAVLWAAETGITTGYSDGTFRPDAECTRGQVVTFLWRAKGMPTPTKTDNPFADVPAGKYYTTAILWALENNITKGRTATTFGPDDACTRGHVVTFLYRAYA